MKKKTGYLISFLLILTMVILCTVSCGKKESSDNENSNKGNEIVEKNSEEESKKADTENQAQVSPEPADNKQSSEEYNFGIKGQPENTVVDEGKTAYFSVSAEGEKLNYRWQYCYDGESAWQEWTSKKEAEISVEYNSVRNNMSVRCIVADGKGNEETSATVKLTYNILFVVEEGVLKEYKGDEAKVTVPESVKELGEKSFRGKKNVKEVILPDTLETIGKNAFKGSGLTTVKIPASVKNIAENVFDSCKNLEKICVARDSSAEEYVKKNYSEFLEYFGQAVEITEQPTDATVKEGSETEFFVKAEGDGLTYQWQYRYAGKEEWTVWKGKNADTVSVAYEEVRNGMGLRCLVMDNNGGKVTSNEVILTYKNCNPVINKQPESAEVGIGRSADFSVEASGVDGAELSYQWQFCYAGKDNWVNWKAKTAADISVAYAEERDGMSLRCVITDSEGGKTISNEVKLAYKAVGPIITRQPANIVVAKRTEADFSVEATGEGLTYQWQFHYAGETKWVNWKAKTTAEILVGYDAVRDGMSLRCIVKDSNGDATISEEAVLEYMK